MENIWLILIVLAIVWVVFRFVRGRFQPQSHLKRLTISIRLQAYHRQRNADREIGLVQSPWQNLTMKTTNTFRHARDRQ